MKKQTAVDRAPRARCYECGSTVIHSLCHHCGKPMCAKDSPVAFRQTAGQQAAGEDVTHTAKPASREFAWLKQSDSQRGAVYHCEEHAHSVTDWPTTLIVWGVIVAVVGVLILLLVSVPGILVLLIGAGLVAAGLVLRSRQEVPAPADRLPLPLFPHVSEVEVVERLTGRVSLVNGDYTSYVDGPVSGEITVDMSANDARKWLPEYRRKYRLPENEPVRFSAGFAVLGGKAGLSFANGQDVVLKDGTALWLRGDSAGGHPLFENLPGRRPGEWRLTARYQVLPGSSVEKVPLWIVPSIVPSSDRRTLEIDLHWNQFGPEGEELTFSRFKSIELKVPKDWGTVQSSSVDGPMTDASRDVVPTIDSNPKGFRVVCWDGIRQQRLKDESGRILPDEIKSYELKLQFARPILWVPELASDGTPVPEPPEEPRFEGSLTAIFERAEGGRGASAGTLSGIQGVDLYLPGGGRARQQPEVRVRTEVTVNFEISLSAARYQDDWVVPDDGNAWDTLEAAGRAAEYEPRHKEDIFFGVVPDHQVVGELTDLISKQGYYVKSVVEHPPYRDDGPGNVVNRVWDIAGRWYDGVFPIDFDINLRGAEVGDEDRGIFNGRTTAQVVVKGTYVNEKDLTQRNKVGERWKDLYDHVTGLLKKRAEGGGGPHPIASASAAGAWRAAVPDTPVAEAWDGAARPGAMWENRFAADANIVDAEIVEESPSARAPVDDTGRADQVTELKQQKSAARSALYEGRITPDMYRETIAEIDAELRELGA